MFRGKSSQKPANESVTFLETSSDSVDPSSFKLRQDPIHISCRCRNKHCSSYQKEPVSVREKKNKLGSTLHS